MPGASLTQKQENFARAYVETGNAAEAYRRAYNVRPSTLASSIWRKASLIMDNASVAARVQELQQEARDRTMITVENLTEKLEAARKHAMSDEKGASAAVSAIMGMAKLHGLIIDKKELTGADGGPVEVRHTTFTVEFQGASPNERR